MKFKYHRNIEKQYCHRVGGFFYDYSLELYINNEMYVALDDPAPITTGGLTLHFSPEGGKTGAVSLDNMVVCELSEPYVPPVVEETTE